MSKVQTIGVHHIGLTVTDLSASAGFFTDLLGWQQVGGNPEYPALFVSDGQVMVTLWQVKSPESSASFDKDNQVGLHHLALTVESLEKLGQLYQMLVEAKIKIEFSPELLRQGPTTHMMCYEPSGNRIEFIVLL